MIKRLLYFGNPAYLSVKLAQLEIRLPQVENNETLSDYFKESVVKRVPIDLLAAAVVKQMCLICQRYKFKSKSQQSLFYLVALR